MILGIVAFFPTYLGGASLAQQPAEAVPHAIYLAVWTASAVLILLGGVRLRLGALLGAGMSAVTFGLFFADAGTAVAGGAHVGGAGLWLALAGWLACAAGSVLALLVRPAGRREIPYQPGRPARLLSLGRPRGAELGPVVMLALAGLGVAAAFAPAWDSYVLRTAAGQSQTFTEGNAFANPGLVIAGNVAVMVALAAVVILAALWRPVRHGAVLLAGAAIPMAAQAISALVQVGGTTSPTQFGLTPAQATAAWPHDRFGSHAGLLDLLRVPRGAGRLLRVDAVRAARRTPIGAGLAGRTRRLRLESRRSGRRTRGGRGSPRDRERH